MKQSKVQSIIFSFFLPLFLTLACSAQEKVENKSDDEPPTLVETVKPIELKVNEINKINPTPDENAPFKVYIPKDLDDSFIELNKMLHPQFIEKFKKGGKDEVIGQHFGLGIWMRNNWGLWAKSRLAKYFNSLEIFHPDDMSGIILTSFQHHLNNQPLEIEKQVEFYKEFWKKQAAQRPENIDTRTTTKPKKVKRSNNKKN